MVVRDRDTRYGVCPGTPPDYSPMSRRTMGLTRWFAVLLDDGAFRIVGQVAGTGIGRVSSDVLSVDRHGRVKTASGTVYILHGEPVDGNQDEWTARFPSVRGARVQTGRDSKLLLRRLTDC